MYKWKLIKITTLIPRKTYNKIWTTSTEKLITTYIIYLPLRNFKLGENTARSLVNQSPRQTSLRRREKSRQCLPLPPRPRPSTGRRVCRCFFVSLSCALAAVPFGSLDERPLIRSYRCVIPVVLLPFPASYKNSEPRYFYCISHRPK